MNFCWIRIPAFEYLDIIVGILTINLDFFLFETRPILQDIDKKVRLCRQINEYVY